MIGKLRTFVWSVIFVLSAVAALAFLAYVAEHGIDQKVVTACILGVLALLAGAWYWITLW